jgi:hypothetical protein
MRFIPEAPNSTRAAKDIARRLPGGQGRRDPAKRPRQAHRAARAGSMQSRAAQKSHSWTPIEGNAST